MTSTTAHAGPARLERPHDGRMVAGAAAGIARHLNVDPVLVRIGFIVAAIAGGFGFAAYLAAYLLIPEEGSEQPVLRAAGSGRATKWAGIALLAIGTIAALDAFDGHGIVHEMVWASILAGAGGFLLLHARGDTAPVTEATVPMGPSPDAPPAPAPRRSRVATRSVAGVLLLVAAAVTAIGALGDGLGWQETTAIAVIAAGGTLVAGSFFGASPWLVLPPLAVAASVGALGAAGAAFDGPIGDRSFTPALAGELPETYQVAIGALHVDLRDVDFAEGTTTRLRVRVGIGEAHVELPDDVAVRITGHTGAGEVRLPGGSSDGTDVDRVESFAAPGRPMLELEVRAGLGEVRVERNGEPLGGRPSIPTPPGQ